MSPRPRLHPRDPAATLLVPGLPGLRAPPAPRGKMAAAEELRHQPWLQARPKRHLSVLRPAAPTPRSRFRGDSGRGGGAREALWAGKKKEKKNQDDLKLKKKKTQKNQDQKKKKNHQDTESAARQPPPFVPRPGPRGWSPHRRAEPAAGTLARPRPGPQILGRASRPGPATATTPGRARAAAQAGDERPKEPAGPAVPPRPRGLRRGLIPRRAGAAAAGKRLEPPGWKC